MSMVGFLFIMLVLLAWLALVCINRFVTDRNAVVQYTKWVLLVASYAFICYGSKMFAAILAGLTLTTWYTAKNKRIAFGVIVALIALGYFKYTNFFLETVCSAFNLSSVGTLNILLPLGISFYTFSAIGYIVDVGNDKLESRNLLDVALYLSFFPKITCGPIQKSIDFFKQVDTPRIVDTGTLLLGLQVFAFGLFKKMVLADRLAVFVNQVYDTPLAFSGVTVFLASVAYSFQIYFDFSGYSDMAISVGMMLGFKLPDNFNLPYMSYSITEFWKRWHISLSGWLQEYLYIPMGGNRKGIIRTFFNLFLTMVLGGLWHGANWTFICWGAIHGIGLIWHKLWRMHNPMKLIVNSRFYNAVSIVVTFLFVNYCWIFFRAESMENAVLIIKRSVGFDVGLQHLYVWLFVAVVVYCFCVILAWKRTSREHDGKQLRREVASICPVNGYYPTMDMNKFWNIVWFLVFCGLLLCLAYTDANPFIYGRF